MPEIAKKAGFVVSVIFAVKDDIKEDCGGAREKAIHYQRQRAPCGGLFHAPPIKQSVKRRSNRKRQEILLLEYTASQTKRCGDGAKKNTRSRPVFESCIKKRTGRYRQGRGHRI